MSYSMCSPVKVLSFAVQSLFAIEYYHFSFSLNICICFFFHSGLFQELYSKYLNLHGHYPTPWCPHICRAAVRGARVLGVQSCQFHAHSVPVDISKKRSVLGLISAVDLSWPGPGFQQQFQGLFVKQ